MDVRFVCAANMFFLVELLPHRGGVLTRRHKLVVKELTLPIAEARGFTPLMIKSWVADNSAWS